MQLKYKEYTAEVYYDEDYDFWVGKLLNTGNDIITIGGRTEEELKDDFELTVNDYIMDKFVNRRTWKLKKVSYNL